MAIWPDEVSVSLWGLPPRDLAATLFQMVESGTGPAAYYADVMQAVLTLAVTARPGPPPNGTAFLERLEPGWLDTAYAADPPRLAALASARRHMGDISLRYRTLLDRLGPALDHGGTLADADAWYFVLEGTREQSVDRAMIYHKQDNQITCRATITPATPAALAAIIAGSETPDLAALLTKQDHPSDLSRHPGAAVLP